MASAPLPAVHEIFQKWHSSRWRLLKYSTWQEEFSSQHDVDVLTCTVSSVYSFGSDCRGDPLLSKVDVLAQYRAFSFEYRSSLLVVSRIPLILRVVFFRCLNSSARCVLRLVECLQFYTRALHMHHFYTLLVASRF